MEGGRIERFFALSSIQRVRAHTLGAREDASTPAAITQVCVKEWNRALNWKCNQPGDV